MRDGGRSTQSDRRDAWAEKPRERRVCRTATGGPGHGTVRAYRLSSCGVSYRGRGPLPLASPYEWPYEPPYEWPSNMAANRCPRWLKPQPKALPLRGFGDLWPWRPRRYYAAGRRRYADIPPGLGGHRRRFGRRRFRLMIVRRVLPTRCTKTSVLDYQYDPIPDSRWCRRRLTDGCCSPGSGLPVSAWIARAV